MNFDVVTIGGATRDITFFTDQGVLIDNKKDPTRERLFAFEYGAKIKIKEAYFTLGGGACNTAVAFSRLGLRAAPIIRIGNDKNGQAILDDLKKEGINTKFVQVDKKLPTGFSFIVASGRGRDHVAFLYRGANDKLLTDSHRFFTDFHRSQIKWFYVSSLTGRNWKNILNKLYNISNFQSSTFNPQICWNPGATQLKAGYRGLAKYLRKTDVLILNKDEATELVLSQQSRIKQLTIKKLLKVILSWGPKIAVITCGAKGAYIGEIIGEIRGKTCDELAEPFVKIRDIKVYYSPALKKKKVDTTGAGDAFGSSFIAGLILYKNNIKKALKLAILNSGSVVQHIGAQNGLLKMSDVRAQMSKN
jgi:ribokinase